METHTEVDKAHGRVEERKVYLCRDLLWLTRADRWKDLHFIALVVRQRTILRTGITTTERTCYIGSWPDASAEQVAERMRGHWGVDNSLHWVLDVAFREDHARHRAGNTARNMAIIRHMALNLLKSEPTKRLGVANRRKLAGWSRGYLTRILTGSRT